MQAVEFEQMRGDRGIAFDLVHMRDVEPVAGPRIVRRPIHAAERRPQRETPDAAHAIDADCS